MDFREEWAQIKAETASRTRLNADSPSNSRGGSDQLVVNQDDLGAVGSEAYLLHDKLQKRSDLGGKNGRNSTEIAGKELKRSGFSLGDELVVTSGVWGTQVRTVLQACAHISNHLDYSKKRYAKEDERIEASMRRRNGNAVSVSEISKLFK